MSADLADYVLAARLSSATFQLINIFVFPIFAENKKVKKKALEKDRTRHPKRHTDKLVRRAFSCYSSLSARGATD
jgi:hypothetical protein